ncbi:MAG TPA: type II secretion system protein [Tepidisphaeraceae bacterium]
MRRRSGFTLIELLVVVGIIALLLTLLFPAIRRVRRAALNTICAARLRDLSSACSLYKADGKIYPLPNRASPIVLPGGAGTLTIAAGPQHLDLPLLNLLARYFRYTEVQVTTPAVNLPPALVCPSIEAVDANRGPMASTDPSIVYYYTGYTYLAGLDQIALAPAPPPPNSSIIPTLPIVGPILNPLVGSLLSPLKSNRAANLQGTKRAVLWADDLHWTLSGGYWQYPHAAGAVTPGPLPMTYLNSRSCDGQHRVYTDGSVEWVKGSELDLNISSDAARNASASLKDVLDTYWWY